MPSTLAPPCLGSLSPRRERRRPDHHHRPRDCRRNGQSEPEQPRLRRRAKTTTATFLHLALQPSRASAHGVGSQDPPHQTAAAPTTNQPTSSSGGEGRHGQAWGRRPSVHARQASRTTSRTQTLPPKPKTTRRRDANVAADPQAHGRRAAAAKTARTHRPANRRNAARQAHLRPSRARAAPPLPAASPEGRCCRCCTAPPTTTAARSVPPRSSAAPPRQPSRTEPAGLETPRRRRHRAGFARRRHMAAAEGEGLPGRGRPPAEWGEPPESPRSERRGGLCLESIFS